MSAPNEKRLIPSRRNFLLSTGGLAAAAGAGFTAGTPAVAHASPTVGDMHRDKGHIDVFGAHQAGITTPQQAHTYFAAFDLVTQKRDEVVLLLRTWTDAAARMARGEPTQTLDKPLVASASAYPPDNDQNKSVNLADSGEALNMLPARLTVTFGFGAGLFVKDGKDRYGLAARRPEALIDLPKFVGDQLVPARTGGDLSVQACADDPQVAFHAVRQLARLADGIAEIRWTQTGFAAKAPEGETGRNLMGFKDGTQQPADLDKFVWVGAEGPDWMRGGSYLVVRRIRIALEHWDRMNVGFQEQTVGRHKVSGAPIGKRHERDALDLEAKDQDGNPVIAENAHVRLANFASNEGAQMLRRGYSYNDGVNVTAERWPPWRQAMEYDAGLFFASYQRDPRTGFVKIFQPMAKFDMLNQFVTHTGSGLFACPGGIRDGEYVGRLLFDAA